MAAKRTDALNARLKALGRKETATLVNSSPEPYGYIGRDIYYRYADGKRSNFKCLQQPADSPDSLAEKFLAHLCDSEYQQYLDDHKAMAAVDGVFGENRFPRARERAFLDFRTLAASQSHYECEDHYTSAVKDAVIRKTLCLYFAHHVPGFKEHMLTGSGVSDKKALIRLSWLGNSKSVLIPSSQDMPWYTAAQQARDTLKGWIGAAAQKSAVQENQKPSLANDYMVSIGDINYPKARVEYHENFERLQSRLGLTHGVYSAGAKVSGIPRTEEPFDIGIAYKDGNVVILKGCSWVADGEIGCDGFEVNGKPSYQSEMSVAGQQKVAAGQKIPAGAMVTSDGEVVGKATPSRAIAYPNGIPVGVLTSVEYGDATVMNLSAKPASVTNDAQQVKQEVIDRGYAATMQAIDVPIAPAISDNEGMSGPNAEHVREWQQYLHDHKDLRAGKLLEISNCSHPRAREWAYAHSDREHPNTVEQYANSNFCEVDWYAGKSLIKNYLRLRGITASVETDKTRWSDEKLAVARIIVRGITVDHTIPKQENTWMRLAWEMFTQIAPALGISLDKSTEIGDTVTKETASMSMVLPPGVPLPLSQRAKTEAIEVAYRTAAIKLPDLVRKQLVKRMASKGGKRPSQARLSLAEEMLSGDEGSLIVAGILSLALSASPEFIKSKMPWLDLDRLARELRLNVETRIACAVADMLGMYLDGALEALKEAFGGSQQLLLAESSKPDESALFNGVPKAETVGVR